MALEIKTATASDCFAGAPGVASFSLVGGCCCCTPNSSDAAT